MFYGLFYKLIRFLCQLQRENISNQVNYQRNITHKSIMDAVSSTRNVFSAENSHTQEEEFTNWSTWSRCMDCIQRRMRLCISNKCQGSRIYEEKPCDKRRCKRKSRQKDEFHIVHLNEDSSYLTKQAPSDIWSKWSKWSPCSTTCRTYRIRKCKKPGRCYKKIQKEQAYCYHDGSSCEVYVISLMENSHRNSHDNGRFQYNNEDRDTAIRKPKKRIRRCGIPNRKTKMLKIIGGSEAKKYKWPWHVAVLNQHMVGSFLCGGTLIASRWVLTANHCIRKYLRVRLNAHDLRATDGRDIEMTVLKMFPHPKFDYKTVDNDIALLLLPRQVQTQVACLPNKAPKVGQPCSVMGWGKVHSSDVYGIPILHEPKVITNICSFQSFIQRLAKKSYKQFLISDNMVCAGWASGKADTCAGDSGGGLMCPVKKRNRKIAYSVQGITSFGDGCGRKNKYGIYTTVFNYVGWINYVINHYS
ncbi:hypothetical protein NQ317_007760 [Molorchus minor]|uniref:Peptidase S1 domain-containing protein n=1 Tax=Molorchus minor TaxID=1323400 RepID=A0ABQ9JDZ1_9CUCU|nr:hypothetical protein NQ317_007760 [Molorchus minor]